MRNKTGTNSGKGDLFEVKLAAFLIFLSAVLYLLHYSIFGDYHHIFLYLIGDIAFLPIEVLLVTIIIDRLLQRREKKVILNKMNMVIGVFFSEVGIRLLSDISREDRNLSDIRENVLGDTRWSARDVAAKRAVLISYRPDLDSRRLNLPELKDFLMDKRSFLLVLLENPNLLEHEHFTDLLWAVFHLLDELSHRDEFVNLPGPDYAHLTGDINRAYLAILFQWVDYMKHLKQDYPYLFSLAIRSNPFDPEASIAVRQ